MIVIVSVCIRTYNSVKLSGIMPLGLVPPSPQRRKLHFSFLCIYTPVKERKNIVLNTHQHLSECWWNERLKKWRQSQVTHGIQMCLSFPLSKSGGVIAACYQQIKSNIKSINMIMDRFHPLWLDPHCKNPQF